MLTDVTSLSWSEACFWYTPWDYIGQVQFEIILTLHMAVSLALTGAVVSVGAWDAEAPPAPYSGSVFPALLVWMEGGSVWLSGWKMTRQMSRATSSTHLLFSLPLVGVLEIVWTIQLELGKGGQLVWLQQFSDGKLLIQSWFDARHAHEVDFLHIVFNGYMQHCRELWHCVPVSWGPCRRRPWGYLRELLMVGTRSQKVESLYSSRYSYFLIPIVVRFTVSDVKFSVSVKVCYERIFLHYFKTMHSMFVLGKYAQS